ncbi:hypothetical protein EVAR_93106_1 [Eumeta japonica]|uniref:Uncharacterized protein n=1 Tax=Eumeta variegata TaxID=151549 RepID=A0A4C1TIL3_EUMVA|nr:hypothetical protein EVAR_93106_1 [Eumeta japonica]
MHDEIPLLRVRHNEIVSHGVNDSCKRELAICVITFFNNRTVSNSEVYISPYRDAETRLLDEVSPSCRRSVGARVLHSDNRPACGGGAGERPRGISSPHFTL